MNLKFSLFLIASSDLRTVKELQFSLRWRKLHDSPVGNQTVVFLSWSLEEDLDICLLLVEDDNWPQRLQNYHL